MSKYIVCKLICKKTNWKLNFMLTVYKFTCITGSPVMASAFPSLVNYTTVIQFSDGSFLIQKVVAGLKCLWSDPSLCIVLFAIMCVSLLYLTDELEYSCTNPKFMYFGSASNFRASILVSRTCISTPQPPPPPPPHTPNSFLLTLWRRFFCWNSALFVRRWFHIWRLLCHSFYLISSSFAALGSLYFVIKVVPGHPHLYYLMKILRIKPTYNMRLTHYRA